MTPPAGSEEADGRPEWFLRLLPRTRSLASWPSFLPASDRLLVWAGGEETHGREHGGLFPDALPFLRFPFSRITAVSNCVLLSCRFCPFLYTFFFFFTLLIYF